MADVKLSDRLNTYYNNEGGQKADSMVGLVGPLYESITNTMQKYESLKVSIQSSWSTNNNQTTVEAIDLVKDAVSKVGDATETLQGALNDAVTLNALIVEIKALVEKYNSMKPEGGPDKDGNMYFTSEQNADREKIAADVRDKNNEGEQQYNKIKSTLESVSLAEIENSSGKGMFSDFVDKRRKDFSIDIDLQSLLAFGSKWQKSDYLCHYYTKEQLYQYLASITAGHTGREKAVLSAVGIIKLCAEKGFGIKYNYGSKDIMRQIDCSGFVSWVVQQAVPDFQKRGSSGFQAKSLGASYTKYSLMKPGDVLCVPGHHVMMVVKNDPSTGKVIIAHAGSPVKLVTKTYHELKYNSAGSYNAIDMTNVYARAGIQM